MIPSTFLEGIINETAPGGLAFGNTGSARSDGFANILGRLTAGGADGETTAAPGNSLPGGQSFLTQLKKEYMATGRCLEDYTADEEAVAEFGSILIKLGFSAEEVEEMVSNLNSRAVGNDVTLADLFKAASQLSEPEDEGNMAAMLDVSALPTLEGILSRLGLDLNTSRDILADALVEGQGIDLRTLAAGIRRGMGAMDAESGTATGSTADVLEQMQLIGLLPPEETSLEASPDELMSEEGDGADGLSGSLLLSYLKKLAASLGDDGSAFQQLIASAGKEDGGIDGSAFLSRLAQMKQAAGSTVSISETAGKAVGLSDAGEINLERFAAILESRVAEADALSGAARGASAANRPLAEMVGGFMEKTSTAAENTSEKLVLPVDPEGEEPFKTSWQPGVRRFASAGSRRSAAATAAETAGKDAAGQSAAQASRQTVSAVEAQRQMGTNASGTESAERFSDTLNAAGSDKTGNTAEDPRFGVEGLVRDMKAGDEAASFGKTTASRNLPGYLLNQVSRQIIRLRNAGENEMTLQLKPPHLGRMKLNIEHTSGGIKVGIVVESVAAKDMLLANSHDLKAALADQGLRLDRIDVEAQADFGQSMAQAGRGFGQSGGRKGQWAGQSQADAGGSSEDPTGTATEAGRVDSGRLDLVA